MSSYVKLSVKEKIAYGLGDGACNISLALVTLFLLYFYTEIYGLTAAEGGLIFLTGRILEGVFNLILGFLLITQRKNQINSDHIYYMELYL